MNKFFITTPIYYVNDVPHIGHAYPTVAADVLTRYWKCKGYDARLLVGTDEHGAKIAEAAKKHNQQPKDYADKISEEFKQAWEKLDIDFVRFIRTTDEDHIKMAQKFLQKLYDKGAIDAKPRLYKGLYCVGHEKFMSPEELVNGLCPDHQTKPIEHSEENYYFKLTAYQKQLEQLITSDTIKISPQSRKNEILGKIKQGLEDISISRANLEWGIPLPFDCSHTAYVWIEALINYYTYGSQNNFWPADLHLVGKDILWFHAIIWPAMLLAIDEKLPKQIFAHGFFTVNGQKMSKTLGNVISPDQLVEKYGVDGTRYVLLAAFPFGEDGDFSWDALDRLYNADLANGLGNLVARVAKLCENITISDNNPSINKLVTSIPTTSGDITTLYAKALENYRFDEALKLIWDEIRIIDHYINNQQPWKLKGQNLINVMQVVVDAIRYLNLKLQPFLPETSEKILKQFSGAIKSQPPLFPRI
ncbi:MAG: methionine--tRNA ligase [Candidatus Daviesbacteria bacterium]|nr:methionine--tRNA ligase [Candidatus Daviesbacteria bacterium]